jgi:uncharacterized cupredoxin-like copper-binding protein
MTRLAIIAAFAALSAAAIVPAAAGSGQGEHEHHHHADQLSAGEPGNPDEPSRTIQVTMQESDGKMLFVPDRIEVHTGEQIRFVLYNSGELEHEFVLATPEENLEHAKAMEMNPQMTHTDPNARRVAPKQTDEMLWKFTKPGQFQYACLIPGHLQAGMSGTVDVK